MRADGPHSARRWYERVIAITDPDGHERRRAEVGLAHALAWSGHAVEAEELATELLARLTDPELVSSVLTARTEARLLLGRYLDAGSDLEAASALPGVPASAASRLRAEASLGHLLGGDLTGAGLLADRAAAEGESGGDAVTVTVARCTQSWVANLRGDAALSIDLARDAVAWAERNPDGEAYQFHPHLFLAIVLLFTDRFDEAARALETGQRLSGERGGRWGQSIYCFARAVWHLNDGRWDDSLGELRTGLAVAEESGMGLALVWAHSMTIRISVARGDFAAATAAADAGDAEIAVKGPVQFGVDWLLWGKALLAEAEGDAARAVALIDNAWALDTAAGIRAEYPEMGPDYVRLLLGAGRVDDAVVVAAAVESVVDGSPLPWSVASARICRGLVNADADVLTGAVSVARECGRPLVHALACEAAAGVVAGTGRGEDAAGLLDEALQVYERLDASHCVARVTAALRGVGVRRVRGRRRRGPATGWEALSDTQRAVARLVADGLTNREIGERMFISRRTVETHLSQVFAKLGISSRADVSRYSTQ